MLFRLSLAPAPTWLLPSLIQKLISRPRSGFAIKSNYRLESR